MWFSLASMRKRWGDRPSLAVARAAEAAVADIGAFCEREGIDAWFRRGGYLQVSTAPAHDRVWAQSVAACRELGAADAVQTLSPAEVAARCASPAFRAGVFFQARRRCSPPAWRSASRAAEGGRGGGLESSPVRRLRESPAGVEAHTEGGVVRAGAAVLALGAAAKAPRGPLRNRLTVASSHIVLTEPVPDLLEEDRLDGRRVHHRQPRLDRLLPHHPGRRIAFGWGGGRIAMGARLGGRTELDPELASLVAAHLRAYFPASASAA